MRAVGERTKFYRSAQGRAVGQAAATLRDAASVVRAVESETEWRPTPSAMCDWCPYWDLCPEKRHEWELLQRHHAEPSLLPNPAPAAEDAARAVDDAVEALRRRGEADAAFERARERILAYARATGSTALIAPTGMARVLRASEVEVTPRAAESDNTT